MRIVDVSDAKALARVYDTVLATSFPPSELMPRSWLLDQDPDAGVAVIAAYDDGGALLATAVTELLCPGVSLLAYLAALPSSRGSGVGSQLVGRVVDDAVTAGVHLLLAEVERPDRHRGSPEHGDPTARLRFYERQGAVVLDLPYAQPPIGPGCATVPGMLLLALHRSPQVMRDGGTAIDGVLVARAIEAMLEDESDDDGDLAALRVASHRPTVGIRPLTRWRDVPVSPSMATTEG